MTGEIKDKWDVRFETGWDGCLKSRQKEQQAHLIFLAALGFCCCAQAFSSCGKQGLLFCCGARASHCGGFSCCRAWALGTPASVVVAHRLSSCGARA